jgi:hypothetical protein
VLLESVEEHADRLETVMQQRDPMLIDRRERVYESGEQAFPTLRCECWLAVARWGRRRRGTPSSAMPALPSQLIDEAGCPVLDHLDVDTERGSDGRNGHPGAQQRSRLDRTGVDSLRDGGNDTQGREFTPEHSPVCGRRQDERDRRLRLIVERQRQRDRGRRQDLGFEMGGVRVCLHGNTVRPGCDTIRVHRAAS